MGFLTQPSRPYRDFQIVFTVLTLNFALPSLGYLFTPDQAIAQLSHINVILGGGPYSAPENESHFWRYLGTANVMALAFMCAMLQYNLRRFYVVVIPLTFLKATAATLWLAGFVANRGIPAFLAAAVLDYATSAAFVFFATRAMRDIAAVSDDDLLPRPRGRAA